MDMRGWATTLGVKRGGIKLKPPPSSRPEDEFIEEQISQTIAESTPWARSHNRALAQWLDESADILELITEASHRKHLNQDVEGGVPSDWDWELPLGNEMRTIRGMVRSRCMLRLGENRIDSAIDDYETLARFCTLTGGYRSPIYWYYACGDRYGLTRVEYALINSPLCEKGQLERIEKASLAMGPLVPVKEIIDESLRYQVLYSRLAMMPAGDQTGDINAELREINLFYDDVIEALGAVSYKKVFAELVDIDSRVRSTHTPWFSIGRYLTPRRNQAVLNARKRSMHFHPKVMALINCDIEMKVLHQASSLGRTITRYRLEEGELPPSLEVLKRKRVADFPQNPVTGGDFEYKSHAGKNEFSIYWSEEDGVAGDRKLEGPKMKALYGHLEGSQ